jgi:4-nitrophenyl phosphatase
MYTKKFESLGIQASADEIFGSSYAAAFYLKRHFMPRLAPGKRIYVIGEKGLTEELDSEGVAWTGGPADRIDMADFDAEAIQPDPSVRPFVALG